MITAGEKANVLVITSTCGTGSDQILFVPCLALPYPVSRPDHAQPHTDTDIDVCIPRVLPTHRCAELNKKGPVVPRASTAGVCETKIEEALVDG